MSTTTPLFTAHLPATSSILTVSSHGAVTITPLPLPPHAPAMGPTVASPAAADAPGRSAPGKKKKNAASSDATSDLPSSSSSSSSPLPSSPLPSPSPSPSSPPSSAPPTDPLPPSANFTLTLTHIATTTSPPSSSPSSPSSSPSPSSSSPPSPPSAASSSPPSSSPPTLLGHIPLAPSALSSAPPPRFTLSPDATLLLVFNHPLAPPTPSPTTTTATPTTTPTTSPRTSPPHHHSAKDASPNANAGASENNANANASGSNDDDDDGSGRSDGGAAAQLALAFTVYALPSLAVVYSELAAPFYDGTFSPDSKSLALLPRSGAAGLLMLLALPLAHTATHLADAALGVAGPVTVAGPAVSVFGGPFVSTRIAANVRGPALCACEYVTWNDAGMGEYVLWRVHPPLAAPLVQAHLLRPRLFPTPAAETDDTPKVYIAEMAFDPSSGLALAAAVVHDNFVTPAANGTGVEQVYVAPMSPALAYGPGTSRPLASITPLDRHRQDVLTLVSPSSWYKVSDAADAGAALSLRWGRPLVAGAASPSVLLTIPAHGAFELVDMHFGSAFAPPPLAPHTPRLHDVVPLSPFDRLWIPAAGPPILLSASPRAPSAHPRWSSLFGLDSPLGPIDPVSGFSSPAPLPTHPDPLLPPADILAWRAGLQASLGYFVTSLWDLNVAALDNPLPASARPPPPPAPAKSKGGKRRPKGSKSKAKSRTAAAPSAAPDGAPPPDVPLLSGSGPAALLPDPAARAAAPYLGLLLVTGLSHAVGVHLPQCAVCGIVLITPLACSLCRAVAYCSVACQKRHWAFHSAHQCPST